MRQVLAAFMQFTVSLYPDQVLPSLSKCLKLEQPLVLES